MKTLTIALAFLVMAAGRCPGEAGMVAAGHVDHRRPAAPDGRDPAPVPAVTMPASAPAGVEFLLLVR